MRGLSKNLAEQERRVVARLRPATDQEIDVVARTVVKRLQQANWCIHREAHSEI